MAILLSCSSPKVITYAHAGADFEKYHTFGIKPHSKAQELSRKAHQNFQRLDSLISGQMKSRGYRYSQLPDLVIDYEISTGLSQNSPNTPNQYYDPYAYYWYYPSYSYSAPEQDVEAMVQLEMIDTGSNRTVWTGSADLTLKPRRKDNLERVEQQILEIFSRFEYSAP